MGGRIPINGRLRCKELVERRCQRLAMEKSSDTGRADGGTYPDYLEATVAPKKDGRGEISI